MCRGDWRPGRDWIVKEMCRSCHGQVPLANQILNAPKHAFGRWFPHSCGTLPVGLVISNAPFPSVSSHLKHFHDSEIYDPNSWDDTSSGCQTSMAHPAAILGSAAHQRAGCLWSWSPALATPPGRPALVGRRPPACSCGRPAGPYHMTGGKHGVKHG